jgi:hypothetical protein
MTHPSGVSSGDLQRFSKVATINDEEGFLLVLEQLLAERLASHAARDVSPDIVALAQAMQAPVPHQPTEAELQHGKMLQLAELRRKTNVPVARFAALAGKSRQQLYKEISARKLLALSIGPRLLRVPDWQLVPAALALTQAVLAKTADNVDPWTVYQALSTPDDGFDGKTPVIAVTPSKVRDVADLVCARLGIVG